MQHGWLTPFTRFTTGSVWLVILISIHGYVQDSSLPAPENMKLLEQGIRLNNEDKPDDGVGQMLSVIKMNISSPTPSTEKTIAEVRNILHNTLPEELNFGILPALESLAEKVNLSGSAKMKIAISDGVAALEFKSQQQLSIYSIAQEIVNNVLKHAKASPVSLPVEPVQNKVLLSVKGNGEGVTQQQLRETSNGIGWKNINAGSFFGGTINVRPLAASGTESL